MSINILQKYGVFLHLLRYFSFSIYSFIYFWKLWLCWVFAAPCGFSSRVRAPGGQVLGATAHRLWFWCIGLIVLSIPYPLPVFFAINQSFLGLERPPLLSRSFYHITFLFFFHLFLLVGGWLLYNIVVVDMNQPWIYMCSPCWSPLPPPSPDITFLKICFANSFYGIPGSKILMTAQTI